MQKTRGSRFNAASALKRKDVWSIVTVAAMALYILGWSVLTLAYPDIFDASESRFYAVVSAVASICLLVVSIFDFAMERSVRADRLHRNALTITTLMRTLERELASSTPDIQRMAQLAREYEAAVSETYVNHSERDYKRWLYSRATSASPIIRLGQVVRGVAYGIWDYVTSMFVYALILLCIVGSTLWYTFCVVLRSSS